MYCFVGKSNLYKLKQAKDCTKNKENFKIFQNTW